jgi:hypothetical protein
LENNPQCPSGYEIIGTDCVLSNSGPATTPGNTVPLNNYGASGNIFQKPGVLGNVFHFPPSQPSAPSTPTTGTTNTQKTFPLPTAPIGIFGTCIGGIKIGNKCVLGVDSCRASGGTVAGYQCVINTPTTTTSPPTSTTTTTTSPPTSTTTTTSPPTSTTTTSPPTSTTTTSPPTSTTRPPTPIQSTPPVSAPFGGSAIVCQGGFTKIGDICLDQAQVTTCTGSGGTVSGDQCVYNTPAPATTPTTTSMKTNATNGGGGRTGTTSTTTTTTTTTKISNKNVGGGFTSSGGAAHAPTVPFLTYVNKIDKITIQYPSTWAKTELAGNNPSIPVLFNAPTTPANNGSSTTFMITVNKLASPITTLDNYTVQQIYGLTQSNAVKYNITSLNDTVFTPPSGVTAYHEISYNGMKNGIINNAPVLIPLKGTGIFFVNGNTGYSLLYLAKQIDYQQQLPTIQQMINSFQVSPASAGTGANSTSTAQ